MFNLKLLTLNLHCLEEDNIPIKQDIIVNEIVKRDIDVIFLQEVAQYDDSEILYRNIKASNYAYMLKEKLLVEGIDYNLYFDTIKHSFGKYDEGIAILSKAPLIDVKSNFISKSHDYHFWRSRKMLKADMSVSNTTISFVSTHLGWTDKFEVFEDQIERMMTHLDKNNLLIIAGDFNVSPRTNEYSFVLNQGLYDLYGSNPKYLFDPTHIKDMDLHNGETRIDYIFSNQKLEVLRREVLFNDVRVSDHYGVYIEVKL